MREQMRMNLDGARDRCAKLATAAVEAIQFFNDIEKELKENREDYKPESGPGYVVAIIQKLENSIKALDERLKTVEEITKRLLDEDNDRIIGSVKRYEPGMPQRVIFERMKQDLREWIEKNDIRLIKTYIYTEPDGQRGVEFKDVNAIKKLTTRDDISLTIMGWPTVGLVDGATYTPEELLITGEAGKE